jgi:hypothetical protein
MADADNDNPNTPKHLEDAAMLRRMYRLLMGQLHALPSDTDRLTVISMMAAGAGLFAVKGDKEKAHAFLETAFLPVAKNMLDAVEADFKQAINDLKIKQAARPNRFIPKKDKPS